MKKIIFLLFNLFILSNINYALGPRDKDIDLATLVGKRMYETPLYEWLEKYSYKTASEQLQTDGPTLFVKHYQKGYSMMFDINMVLNSLSIYNKGGKFERFKGKLPFNLKFGMNRDSLYRVIDLKLVEVEDNPFVLTRTGDKVDYQFMFTSKGLNQVNIINTDTISHASDVNFVRLVSNGTLISGDCDSLTGKMSWNDGQATYEGEWENNLPHGKGYFKDQNNNWYKGDFKYGYFWGTGQMSVSKLYQYTGDFVMSRRQGTGTCKFIATHEIYEGQWLNDAMNGLGKYTTSPTNYYYGNMKDNQFNGIGKLITAEGSMEGNFTKGLLDGMMKQFLKLENLMIEGEWVNGKREGKFKITNLETNKVSYRKFVGDIEIIDK